MLIILYRFPSHATSIEAKRTEKQRVIGDLREKMAKKGSARADCLFCYSTFRNTPQP